MTGAPGVVYFEHELMPGRPVFTCVPLGNCTLTPQACADRWKGSQGRDARYVGACQRCPTGAVHAGQPSAAGRARPAGRSCCRCGRSDLRLVFGRLCVSCSNRDRELRAGRNAKGSAPSGHPGLHRLAQTITMADDLRQRLARDAVSTRELQQEALRDATAMVIFEFTPDSAILAFDASEYV